MQPLLEARGAAGLIRRGHGDLHLGNIAVLDGEPVAFDALEFDPIIAEGDVLYDLAFLLMDLVERGLPRAANIVLNGYFAASRRSEDYDGIAALPFFMSLRAAIRAKVTAARRDLASAADRDDLAQSAQALFRSGARAACSHQAGDHLHRRVIGHRQIAAGACACAACRSSARRADIPLGRGAQSALRRGRDTIGCRPRPIGLKYPKKSIAALTDKAVRVARAGYSVIVDAVFARPEERAAIEAAAAAAHAEFRGLFLVADLPTRLNRVGSRGPDASDADARVARMQAEFDIGTVTWTIVDASGSPEQTLANARAAMAIK